MENTLLDKVTYKIEQTRWGTWRRHYTATGGYFAEFRSHAELLGIPVLHYTRGKCPETGRRVIAKGIVAVGRLAFGVVAVGHASLGLIAVGQLALGILFGLGQGATGMAAVGQLAVGYSLAAGQLAMGRTVIAQLGLGEYVLAQVGIGDHVWSTQKADPEAVVYFRELWQRLSEII